MSNNDLKNIKLDDLTTGLMYRKSDVHAPIAACLFHGMPQHATSAAAAQPHELSGWRKLLCRFMLITLQGKPAIRFFHGFCKMNMDESAKFCNRGFRFRHKLGVKMKHMP